MRPVRIAGRQAPAVVLEPDLGDAGTIGAVVVVKAELLVVATVTAVDAHVGRAAILRTDHGRDQARCPILVEIAVHDVDGRTDAAATVGKSRTVLLVVLEERIVEGTLEDIAFDK